jgi:uncharacterized protein YrrD
MRAHVKAMTRSRAAAQGRDKQSFFEKKTKKLFDGCRETVLSGPSWDDGGRLGVVNDLLFNEAVGSANVYTCRLE